MSSSHHGSAPFSELYHGTIPFSTTLHEATTTFPFQYPLPLKPEEYTYSHSSYSPSRSDHLSPHYSILKTDAKYHIDPFYPSLDDLDNKLIGQYNQAISTPLYNRAEPILTSQPLVFPVWNALNFTNILNPLYKLIKGIEHYVDYIDVEVESDIARLFNYALFGYHSTFAPHESSQGIIHLLVDELQSVTSSPMKSRKPTPVVILTDEEIENSTAFKEIEENKANQEQETVEKLEEETIQEEKNEEEVLLGPKERRRAMKAARKKAGEKRANERKKKAEQIKGNPQRIPLYVDKNINFVQQKAFRLYHSSTNESMDNNNSGDFTKTTGILTNRDILPYHHRLRLQGHIWTTLYCIGGAQVAGTMSYKDALQFQHVIGSPKEQRQSKNPLGVDFKLPTYNTVGIGNSTFDNINLDNDKTMVKIDKLLKTFGLPLKTDTDDKDDKSSSTTHDKSSSTRQSSALSATSQAFFPSSANNKAFGTVIKSQDDVAVQKNELVNRTSAMAKEEEAQTPSATSAPTHTATLIPLRKQRPTHPITPGSTYELLKALRTKEQFLMMGRRYDEVTESIKNGPLQLDHYKTQYKSLRSRHHFSQLDHHSNEYYISLIMWYGLYLTIGFDENDRPETPLKRFKTVSEFSSALSQNLEMITELYLSTSLQIALLHQIMINDALRQSELATKAPTTPKEKEKTAAEKHLQTLHRDSLLHQRLDDFIYQYNKVKSKQDREKAEYADNCDDRSVYILRKCKFTIPKNTITSLLSPTSSQLPFRFGKDHLTLLLQKQSYPQIVMKSLNGYSMALPPLPPPRFTQAINPLTICHPLISQQQSLGPKVVHTPAGSFASIDRTSLSDPFAQMNYNNYNWTYEHFCLQYFLWLPVLYHDILKIQFDILTNILSKDPRDTPIPECNRPSVSHNATWFSHNPNDLKFTPDDVFNNTSDRSLYHNPNNYLNDHDVLPYEEYSPEQIAARKFGLNAVWKRFKSVLQFDWPYQGLGYGLLHESFILALIQKSPDSRPWMSVEEMSQKSLSDFAHGFHSALSLSIGSQAPHSNQDATTSTAEDCPYEILSFADMFESLEHCPRRLTHTMTSIECFSGFPLLDPKSRSSHQLLKTKPIAYFQARWTYSWPHYYSTLFLRPSLDDYCDLLQGLNASSDDDDDGGLVPLLHPSGSWLHYDAQVIDTVDYNINTTKVDGKEGKKKTVTYNPNQAVNWSINFPLTTTRQNEVFIQAILHRLPTQVLQIMFGTLSHESKELLSSSVYEVIVSISGVKCQYDLTLDDFFTIAQTRIYANDLVDHISEHLKVFSA